MAAVRSSYAIAAGSPLSIVLVVGEQAALWALNTVCLVLHVEPGSSSPARN